MDLVHRHFRESRGFATSDPSNSMDISYQAKNGELLAVVRGGLRVAFWKNKKGGGVVRGRGEHDTLRIREISV